MRALRDSLTTRGLAFTSAGLVLLASGILLGQPDLLRIGVLLLVVVAIAASLGRRHNLTFDVHRVSSPGQVSVDGHAHIRVQITNTQRARSPVALAEEVLDHSLGDRPRFIIGPIGQGQLREFDYTVRPHLRGVHALGPLAIRVRDPFGLTSRPASLPGTGSLVVVPKIHPLTSSGALGQGRGSEGSLPHRVALHGEDDQTVREYRDGDDLRRIHWPATARTGEVMVRQEDRPARRRATILLDSRTLGHHGHGRSSSFEWCVSMAASAAHHLHDAEYVVQLVTADSGSDTGTRVDTDEDAMLRTLAGVTLSPDDGLRAILHSSHDLTGAGGLIIALVGGLDDGAARALASLRQPGSMGIALVLQPTSSGAGRQDRERLMRADQTLTGLRSAGWSALPIGPEISPSEAWSRVTSGQVVGAR